MECRRCSKEKSRLRIWYCSFGIVGAEWLKFSKIKSTHCFLVLNFNVSDTFICQWNYRKMCWIHKTVSILFQFIRLFLFRFNSKDSFRYTISLYYISLFLILIFEWSLFFSIKCCLPLFKQLCIINS